MWEMHDREFESVLSLDGPARYDYFVKHVADRGSLWSLKSEETGFVLAGDATDQAVPVWPHPRFAEVAATDRWADAHPAEIDVDDWLESWTPGMGEDGRSVAVFPTPAGRGVIVPPGRLAEDLEAELARLG